MKQLCTLILVFIISSAYSQTEKKLKGIEKDLINILEVTKAPSFAVAIVKGDKVVYSKGFGLSDVENNIQADANTLYAIGSCTKAFTSGLLGLLQAEDKLSFDENPRKYLPSLEFYNNDLNNNLIIKDLMSHRTGIPRHDLSWYLFPTADTDSIIERIKFQEPFTGIRQQWYYNNFMFLVQGAIAEKITDKSWQENIEEHFFKPLNMSRSNATIGEMKSATNRAIGYEMDKDENVKKMDYYNISSMSPAGSINSSVNDMSKWLITWIHKGKYNGKEILSENYVTDAISSHSIVGPNLPTAEHPDMFFTNYGYGWFLSSYRGHYRVEHGGNIDGFSASASFFPSDSLGIVVLTNQNGSRVPGLVRNTVADRMLKTERTDWAKQFVDEKQKQKKAEEESKVENMSSKVENTRPSHVLPEYTGSYSHPGYGNFKISLENDSLFANFKLIKTYLKHHHYDVFLPLEVKEDGIEEIEEISLLFNFNTNDSGEISSVNIKAEPTLDGITFKRTPNTIDVDKDTLDKYVGDFELAGMEIKVYTKNDTTLYFFVPGQPEYELLATAHNKFSFKVLDGFKVEFIETEGKFNEINVIQPNGTFKATRKTE